MYRTLARLAILSLLVFVCVAKTSRAMAQGVNWNGANYVDATFPQLLDQHSAREVSLAIATHGFKQVRLPFGDALIAKWATSLPTNLATQDHWYRRSNGDWVRAYNYGDLFKSAISELVERGIVVVLDFHPYTDNAFGVDQGFWKYNIWNTWVALLDRLNDSTWGLYRDVRGQIIGADIFNEPHESQWQNWIDWSTDAARMIVRNYRNSGAYPNMKVYLETPINGESSQTTEGGWAASFFDTMTAKGIDNSNAVVEIHIYPFNKPFSWDDWEMRLFGGNHDRTVNSLSDASVQALIQHRAEQARQRGFPVAMGEYGSDHDEQAGAIAKACANLGIRRYRWVLYENGTYGVFDSTLNVIGARTPASEIR